MTGSYCECRTVQRRRGSALLLATIAVAIVLTLGLTFLATTATTTQIVRSHNDSHQARMIAESGLEYAIQYVKNTRTWRADRSNGTWFSDQPFAGGTFAIAGVDGYDEDGDGAIDGDGSLTDNAADPVTLISTGTYNGASCSVSIVLISGSSSIIAVQEKIELGDHALIDSYSAQNGAYGEDNRGEAAAISSNQINQPNITLENGSVIDGHLLLPSTNDQARTFVQNDGTMTGSIRVLPIEQFPVEAAIPPTLAGRPADVVIRGGVTELDADLYCDNLTIEADGVLKIMADVSIVCKGNLTVRGQIQLANPSFGNFSQSGSTQDDVEGKQIATAVTLAEDIQVTSIGAYIYKKNHEVRYAIYSDSGGKPGALLLQTESQTVTDPHWHWKEIGVAPTALSAGTYWVALSFENKNQAYTYTTPTSSNRTWHRHYFDWWNHEGGHGWNRWDGWDRWDNWNRWDGWDRWGRGNDRGGGNNNGGGNNHGGWGGGWGYWHDGRSSWGGWSGWGRWGRDGGGWYDWWDWRRGRQSTYDKTHYKNYGAVTGGFSASWGWRSDDTYNHVVSIYISGNIPAQGVAVAIYTQGETCTITDHARVNTDARRPERVAIHHLYEPQQRTFELSGNSDTWAQVWAPFGELNIKANAQLHGGARVLNLKMEGGGQAHLDDSGGELEPGMVVDNRIEMKSGARIDDLDNGQALVACNSAGSAVIQLDDNSVVKGNAFSGPGGYMDNREIKVQSAAQLTGERGSLTDAVQIINPPIPSILPIRRNITVQNTTRVFASDFTCDDLTIGRDGAVEIEGHITVVVQGNLMWANNATLTLREGATLTLHVSDDIAIRGQPRINVGGDPSGLVIHYHGGNPVQCQDTAQVAATLSAPDAAVNLLEDTHYYGSILCRKLTLKDNAQLHYNASGNPKTLWGN